MEGGGTEQIFGIFGPNFQFGVCRSDIYLIFSPGVHFQLGSAGRSAQPRLSIEIVGDSKETAAAQYFKEEYLDISQVSVYLPQTIFQLRYQAICHSTIFKEECLDTSQVSEDLPQIIFQRGISGYPPSI